MKYNTETIGIISIVIILSSFIFLFAGIGYHILARIGTVLWFIGAVLNFRAMIHKDDMK